MGIPSTPSYSKMPNNLKELLTIQRRYHRRIKTLKEGLNNTTKALKTTTRRVREVKDNVSKFQKILAQSKKITDALQKGAFKQVNPKLGSAVNSIFTLFSAGITIMSIKNQEYIQGIELNINGLVQRDIQNSFTRAINNTSRVRELRTQFLQFVESYKQDKSFIQASIATNLVSGNKSREIANNAKKQANDALYEVRAGREKIEGKILKIRDDTNAYLKTLVSDIASQNSELAKRIEDARLLGNDALYEVRVGREKIEARINNISNKFNVQVKTIELSSQKQLKTIELNLQKQFRTTNLNSQKQVKAIELSLQRQVNNLFAKSNNLINQALRQASLAQSRSLSLQKKVFAMEGDIIRLQKKNLPNLNIEPTVRKLIAKSPEIQGLLGALKAANVKLDGFSISVPTVTKGLKNVATRVQFIDGRVTKLEQGVEVKGLNVVNARISGLNSAVNNLDSKVNSNQSKIQGVDGRVVKLEKGVEVKGLNVVNSRISGLDSAISNLRINVRNNSKNISGLSNQLLQQGNVDKKALIKLDQILGVIPLIPARSAGLITPSIPTIPQIETATTTSICRSTGSGGCMNKALKDTTNTIGQNLNKVGDTINRNIDKLNLGANAAQLALLKKVDTKLGAQVAGGISGAVLKNLERINKFAEWLRIDRVLNVLTWVNTTHNAFMLSSSITNTLFGAIDNVADIFFKDIGGVDIDSKKAVSTYFDNMAKTIFGVEEWKNITTAMKKYNRIYQAGANIINSVRSVVDGVRNITEFVAENTGKIGNALIKFGVIGEKAFSWMPERVNGQSIWLQRLNNLEEAASGIESVTSEVLGITENLNEITKQTEEFNESIRNSSDSIKELQDIEKDDSQSPSIPESSERSA